MSTDAVTQRSLTAIEFLETDPRAIRDASVAFWWQRRHWPTWSLEQYFRMWDWRYSSLSDGPALVCVARDRETGALVGHAAIYRRQFRYNDTPLAVGIPSSLAVDAELQGGLAGARLSSFPSRKLRHGTFDVLLGFTNRIAHEMFVRLGAQDLGRMSEYVDVRHSAPILRNRARILAPLGFVADAGFAMRRQWLRLRRKRSVALEVQEVTGDEFRRLDRSHWVPSRDRVVAADSADFLVRRHLECPYATNRKIHALFVAGSGTCEGFVVTEGTERVELWDVQVNTSRVDLVEAIVAASATFRGAKTVAASALPGSAAASALGRAGLFRTYSERKSDYPRLVDATVRPRHPLESELRDTSRWSFWTGTSQY